MNKTLASLFFALSLITVGRSQNLIINGDFSATNSGFSSGYSYVASGSGANVGLYGVRTNSLSFNSGYTSFKDHTSGNGLMMLLDGSTTTTVAWSETINISTNTDYTFSGWATSSDPLNPATLQFKVNGIQLGGGFPLTTNVVWTNFSNVWFSGTNQQATLAIYDINANYINAQGGGGDDFALDDLSFGVLYPTLLINSANTNVVLTWPTNAIGFTLQSTTNLAPAVWNPVSPAPVIVNTNNVVTNAISGTQMFYQLSH